jgi:hypothetical protein
LEEGHHEEEGHSSVEPDLFIDRTSGFLYKDLLEIEAKYLSKLKSNYEKSVSSEQGQEEEKVEVGDMDELLGVLNKKAFLMNNLITPIEVSLEAYKITNDPNHKSNSEKLYKTGKDILTKDNLNEEEEIFIDYTQKEDGTTLFIPTFNYNQNKGYFQRFLCKILFFY